MPGSYPIVAFWSFASAWMLLWGLAAVAPLVIHLWSRRRYRETQWAAMQFLLAAMRKNARRLAFEQWLLLLLRMLVLLCFALALADPLLTWSARTFAPISRDRALTILVIDASLSMDYRVADRSRFETAREAARKLVTQGKAGDAHALVLLANPALPIIRQPSFDSGKVLEEIGAVQQSRGDGDLSGALALVQEMLEAARKQHPDLVSRRVVFIADLERTTWDEAVSTTGREQIARLAEAASLSLVNVADIETSNLAITRLDASRSLVMPERAVGFQAEVKNFGSQSTGRLPVELFLDGERISERSVELPPGGRSEISFSHTFDAPGEHILEARLRDPRFPLDNTRWLSVPVREALRVLCLEGRPRESRYLALALAPDLMDRRVLITEAADSTLLYQDLFKFDAIALCNIARFTAQEAEALRSYVARGGGLLIFLGDQVQAEQYNEMLGQPANAAPQPSLLPAQMADPVSGSQYRFDPLEYAHPILKPFRSYERSGLLTTPIWKYVRLTPHPDAQTVLGFDNGDPALVSGRLGRGRILLFASAISPLNIDRSANPQTPWNALETWPSFPPLVQEMLEYAVSGDAGSRNVLVGEKLTGTINANHESGVVVRTPEAKSERAETTRERDIERWSFPADRAGAYQVASGMTEGDTQLYAANVDTRESELTSIDPSELPTQLGFTIRDDATPTGPGSDQPRPWFRVFLILMLGLLAVESLVAWRMGR